MAAAGERMAKKNEEGEEEGGYSLPVAKFIEDVEQFLEGREADEVIKEMQGRYQQYKALEQRLLQRKAQLTMKIPEITKTLDAVRFLIKKGEAAEVVTADFELTDGVFAKGTIDNPGKVCLWLGANVMIEYSYQEALELLETNLSNAKTNLETVKSDLGFIRDNVTTTEVSIARVYNEDVRRRRLQKGGAAAK